MARACNIGPKDDVDIELLARLLLNYIDGDTPEAELFELGSYASKHAGCGVDYAQLAAMAPMIFCFLGVSSSGYVKKTKIPTAIEQAIAKRPLRQIHTSVPKSDLINILEKKVRIIDSE